MESAAAGATGPAAGCLRSGARAVYSSDENITCADGERQWSNRSGNERCALARAASDFGCRRDFGEVETGNFPGR